MKRNLLVAIFSTLVTTSLFAINPSSRYETRMVYDPVVGQSLLFGGITGVDSGTKKAYHLNDTWSWTGSRWIQRFPATVPERRAGHVMVYDSTRNRIVMFGGHSDTSDLNDTWVYRNNNWTQILPPDSPPGRILAGGAYDPIRDRVVIYGGTQTSADGKTLTAVYDTWEFDGTTWTKIGGNGPTVTKPILAYDGARNQIIMLALDANAATLMYTYDAASGNWNQVKPATLPACVNEGQMTYNPATQTVVYTGGVCATTEGEGVDTTYEWDGTTWNKITVATDDTRVFGAGMTYDNGRDQVVLFGGSPVVGSPLNDTWVYASKAWFSLSDGSRPAARSLYAFVTDPVNNTIWLYGGTDDQITYSDLWQYNNGQWQQISNATTPTTCVTPQAVFDTDRNKIVMVCANADLYEFDGTTWTAHTADKNSPPAHAWASLVYDPTLKKTVLFGGYDGNSASYLNETWTWDGSTWSRQKNHPPTARALTSMWYDPVLKKDVIYGGVGRVTSTDRVSRYDDMWTFDGNGWTQLSPTGGTPGPRYGAETVVDPHSNHVLLYGGMFNTVTPPVPPAKDPTEVQSYVGDMWDWDGSKWTKLDPATTPGPRENARMAYDPTRDNIVMFGGYAGTFMSDTWVYDGTNWHVVVFDPLGNRRRVTGH